MDRGNVTYINRLEHDFVYFIYIVSRSEDVRGQGYFVITNTLLSFMFFKDLKIPYSKIINTVGASTFGVLMIHANSDTMRRWLWKDVVDCVGHYGDKLFWIYSMAIVLSIFVICFIIDIVRIHYIEQPLFLFIDEN